MYTWRTYSNSNGRITYVYPEQGFIYVLVDKKFHSWMVWNNQLESWEVRTTEKPEDLIIVVGNSYFTWLTDLTNKLV